jgi:hypothetical protein
VTIPAELATHIATLQTILKQDDTTLARYRPSLAALLATLLKWQEQSPSSDTQSVSGVDSGAIAKEVVKQINLQQSEWLYPLQNEMTLLRQQRERLLIEIRQLEGQRQQSLESFLKLIAKKSSEAIKERLAHLDGSNPTTGVDLGEFFNHNYAQIEKLKQLQLEADELFLQLDHTLNYSFSILQQDFVTHTATLGQDLAYLQSLVTVPGAINSFAYDRAEPPMPPDPEDLPSRDLVENVENSDNFDNSLIPPQSITAIPEVNPTTTAEQQLFEEGEFSYEPESIVMEFSNLQSDREQEIPIPKIPSPSLEEFTFPDLQAINVSLENALFGEAAQIRERDENPNGGVVTLPKSAIASSSNAETQIDTIKLLSDLLQEGALDAIEGTSTPSAQEKTSPDAITTENLLPEQEQHLSVVSPVMREHLTADQIEELEKNLNNFENRLNSAPPPSNGLESLDIEEAG